MTFYKQITCYIFVFFLLGLSGCQPSTTIELLRTSNSQVQTRSFQTRAFDTTDKNKMVRTIIATLQDLGFIVEKSDESLGTVSATKLNLNPLRLTVTVRPSGKTQLLVRVNANNNRNWTEIDDPKIYQDFFTTLGKSMFLTAHGVD